MCEKKDSIIILACHGVYDPDLNTMYAEHTEDEEIFKADLEFALHSLRWRKHENPTLVISGGATKIQRRCSESRSYLQMGKSMGLEIPSGILLEEYALTSIENLLLSLYIFHEKHGYFPQKIDVISWEFKHDRFQETFKAINDWINLDCKWLDSDFRFFPVSNLAEDTLKYVLPKEEEYINDLKKGIDNYYANGKTQNLIKNRDPFQTRRLAIERYSKYNLPDGFLGKISTRKSLGISHDLEIDD